MYSTPVKGTAKNKTTLNWWEYWIGHCWMTGWQNIRGSFRIWADLMTGNYKDYALMWYDDPYEECVDWFWQCLGDDDTYPKEFLEYLQQMVEDIELGKVKTYPMEDVFDKLFKELKDEDIADAMQQAAAEYDNEVVEDE
jgi:hypothetical protein